jgi:hypothetical protein
MVVRSCRNHVFDPDGSDTTQSQGVQQIFEKTKNKKLNKVYKAEDLFYGKDDYSGTSFFLALL